MSIVDYGLREKYEQLKMFGDKLADMKNIVDWESLRPLLNDLFTNDTDRGGRPNCDEILMVKILFLQSLYGLVDEAVERELHDRISFINFLDYPETVPDARTIWLFRERLSKTGKDKALWKEIWRQFSNRGITVKRGTIQDATFITSDPGHRRKDRQDMVDPELPPVKTDNNNTANKREVKEAGKLASQLKRKEREDERKNAKTRRSKDGTWTKKNNRSYFGFKLHSVQGADNDMIANYSVTTASLHDSQIDLSIPGIVNYKDKAYFGTEGRGIDAAMDRALKGYKLPIQSIRRNLRITRKRSRGERPYSVIKRMFHGGHVFVTTVQRVRIKAMFMCLGHNLFNLLSLKRRGKIAQAIEIQ
jgi:IS5 family transposase